MRHESFGVHPAIGSKTWALSTGDFISEIMKYQGSQSAIQAIFKRYTDVIEPISDDEAYLDVTKNKLVWNLLSRPAKLIQHEYGQAVDQFSWWLSYNKFWQKWLVTIKASRLDGLFARRSKVFSLSNGCVKICRIKFGKKTVENCMIWAFTQEQIYLEIPEMTLIDLFSQFGFDLYRKARASTIHQ